MTYLLSITLAPSPIPSQIPHTLFDIISLGADAVDRQIYIMNALPHLPIYR